MLEEHYHEMTHHADIYKFKHESCGKKLREAELKSSVSIVEGIV